MSFRNVLARLANFFRGLNPLRICLLYFLFPIISLGFLLLLVPAGMGFFAGEQMTGVCVELLGSVGLIFFEVGLGLSPGLNSLALASYFVAGLFLLYFFIKMIIALVLFLSVGIRFYDGWRGGRKK